VFVTAVFLSDLQLPGWSDFCCIVMLAAVLDDSASVLFMTEIMRGMAYTLGAFFDKKVTASEQACWEMYGQGPKDGRYRVQIVHFVLPVVNLKQISLGTDLPCHADHLPI
jgi:hypothetical protein